MDPFCILAVESVWPIPVHDVSPYTVSPQLPKGRGELRLITYYEPFTCRLGKLSCTFQIPTVIVYQFGHARPSVLLYSPWCYEIGTKP